VTYLDVVTVQKSTNGVGYKAGLIVKFCKKKSKFCFKRNLNDEISKFYCENFCHCKYKARCFKTSVFGLRENIF